MIKFFTIASLLLTIKCDRWTSKGEFRVIGTATVNGKEYVDMRHRAWNTEFTTVGMPYHPFYGIFEIEGIYLQSKDLGDVVNREYAIFFCLTTDDKKQVQINLPYKIEYNKSLEANDYIPPEVVKTLVFDKSKLISPNVNNGIAIVVNLKTGKTYSMEGEVVVHSFNVGRYFGSKGEYILKRPINTDKDELTIKGQFKAHGFKAHFYDFFFNKL